MPLAIPVVFLGFKVFALIIAGGILGKDKYSMLLQFPGDLAWALVSFDLWAFVAGMRDKKRMLGGGREERTGTGRDQLEPFALVVMMTFHLITFSLGAMVGSNPHAWVSILIWSMAFLGLLGPYFLLMGFPSERPRDLQPAA